MITDSVKEKYPELKIAGVLIQDFTLSLTKEEYEKKFQELKEEIRINYSPYVRAEAVKEEPICSYVSFYKRFKKTYPVILQLESLLLKGKDLPQNGPLLESMFHMELKNRILTAGHDFDELCIGKKELALLQTKGEINFSDFLRVDLSNGGESMLGMGNREQELTENDIYLRDEKGILSSILAGPDQRTRITEKTKNVFYFSYGFETADSTRVEQHMVELKNFILALSPNSKVTMLSIE